MGTAAKSRLGGARSAVDESTASDEGKKRTMACKRVEGIDDREKGSSDDSDSQGLSLSVH
jgi:hypothetical protein